MRYADVILPLPAQGLYTYTLPRGPGYPAQEGGRVIVQFGKKKFYTAIVFRVHDEPPKQASVKEIVAALEGYPIVSPLQLRFWEWIASYYMCSLGDVYRAALPAALKWESETRVSLNPGFEASGPFTPNERKVFYSLSPDKAKTIGEIGKLSGLANAVAAIKSLVDKQAAYISENIRDPYSPKRPAAVRLPRGYTEDGLARVMDGLGKAKKQQHVFSTFLHLKEGDTPVLKKALLEEARASASVLSELVKKGILEIYGQETGRFGYGEADIGAAFALNGHQQKAFGEIKESFREKGVTLLHGVTSGGKTEIYIQLIKEAIAEGKQVLYLLPEIALTTQITGRLKAVFGNKLAVYHSKFNDNERAGTWENLLANAGTQVILGARSAVFLPFSQLGLVIVDEEHESSYKQQGPAPRYHARNAAIMLAALSGAKTLLGTATPALETYYNALAGRYGLVRLTKRHENIELPRVAVVNTKELRRKKQMKSILSPPLIDRMREALGKKEQVILFQNRRGFASLLECKNCSWTPRCLNCDVSLTYHKGRRMMMCHYCGAACEAPPVCPECGAPAPDALGYGTERVEEEVTGLFPGASVARMDMDTTRGKKSYEKIIAAFEGNETNILIGTQMVSKGLDFGNVSIVGILNADNLLNYPDFRAYERAFQLMTQVSGRAGRKNKQGLVFLQTARPDSAIINFVKSNDYESFYRLQLEERKLFRYPPFFRLITLVLRARDEHIADGAAKDLALSLRQSFGERVLGPGKPPVSRIQSLHIRHIFLKIELHASIQKVREALYHHQAVLGNPAYKQVLLHYDVDPA